MRDVNLLSVCAAALLTACSEPGASPASPVALRQPGESSAFFAAAVQYLASRAEGRLLADPRPLRRDADLAGVQEEDLAPDAAATVRLRSDALAAQGITATNAVADFRCTFSSGVGLPPERQAALPDSIRQRSRECLARPPYTTLILSLPAPAPGEYPAGTWHVEAVAMTHAGFQIWDLYLRADAVGGWGVADARTRLNIRS